jgi:hypothetical protein
MRNKFALAFEQVRTLRQLIILQLLMKPVLTENLLTLFSIPKNLASLVEIADSRTRPGESEPYLVLVRTKRNYRDIWIKAILREDPSWGETPAKLRALQESGCPVDIYDSGIIFQLYTVHIVQEDGEHPMQLARIVCRTDDYPQQQIVDVANLDSFFAPNTDLREWIEGTVVRVFTLHGEQGHEPEVFYGTRGKIDCYRSRCVQRQDCPTIKEMFNEAFAASGLDPKIFEKPGHCFAFIVVNEWNQLRVRQGVTLQVKPKLVLFRAYQFNGLYDFVSDGENEVYNLTEGLYQELDEPEIKELIGDMSIHLPKLQPDQACEIIRKGGVVITSGAHQNAKFMTSETATEYSWLQKYPSPVMTYFELRGQDLSYKTNDAEHYRSILGGWMKELVEDAIAKRDQDFALAVNYILDRHILSVKSPDNEKRLATHKGVTYVLIAIRNQYYKDKKAWYNAQQETEKSKIGRRRNFIWGGNYNNGNLLARKVIQRTLEALEQNDGLMFFSVLNKCKKFKASEDYNKNNLKESVKNVIENIGSSLKIEQSEEKVVPKKSKQEDSCESDDSVTKKSWAELSEEEFQKRISEDEAAGSSDESVQEFNLKPVKSNKNDRGGIRRVVN